mmetsp:Transcript_2021/g.3010  ORF Transcript_2021/g.3010 Transcript_2021/m.3010 type:complete len:119 (+) Transcript_2021:145-501(+)
MNNIDTTSNDSTTSSDLQPTSDNDQLSEDDYNPTKIVVPVEPVGDILIGLTEKERYLCMSIELNSANFTCGSYITYMRTTDLLEQKVFETQIVISSVYIILMQLGFILLETGQVKKRN